MKTDSQTNTVYFSNLLPEEHPKEFKELSEIIESDGYKVKLLIETYDFYCRDYMPVQVAEDDFVQFVFRTKAYFEPEEYSWISNPVLLELINNLPRPRYSPIILDGGNIAKASDKVIITDRVFKDNSYQFTKAEIIAQLKKDLKCQVIIIPEYPRAFFLYTAISLNCFSYSQLTI
jgi:agmatine deiminase